MSGESAGTIAPRDVHILAVERWVPGMPARDRNFWIALGVAVLLHSTLFLGLLGHQPRQIGDADGSADGISVSVVTEADLNSRSSIDVPPSPPPGPPPAQAAPQAPPPPPPEAKAAEQPPEVKPDLKPDLKPSDFTTETTKAEPDKAEPEKPEAPSETAKDIAKEVPDILALPGPGEEAKKKQQPTAKPPT
ncbi:MAG: energy transducer TonB, partial [Hyphomicrobium sp.]